jgi:hypothetical protein
MLPLADRSHSAGLLERTLHVHRRLVDMESQPYPALLQAMRTNQVAAMPFASIDYAEEQSGSEPHRTDEIRILDTKTHHHSHYVLNMSIAADARALSCVLKMSYSRTLFTTRRAQRALEDFQRLLSAAPVRKATS